MDSPVEIRTFADDPPAWWDEVALGDSSPWHARAHAALQADFGVIPRFLAAFRAGAPAGVACVWLAGSRRAPLLDRLFARVAFVPDEPAVPSGDREVRDALLAAVEAEVRASRAVESTFRVEMPRRLAPEDLAAAGYDVALRGVGILALPATEAEADDLPRPPARRQARKAERLGVAVRVEATVDPLLPLLDRSFSRAGLAPRDHGYVRALHRRLRGEVLVAGREGRDVAALLWAVEGPVGLNVFHGRADGDIEGAANLLHREMFRRAVRRGVRLLHTGDAAMPGETDPRLVGITRFKESMGFEIRTAFAGTRTLRPRAAALRARLLSLRGRGRRT